MKFKRTLLYEGPHDWVTKTLARSFIQPDKPQQGVDSEGYVQWSISDIEDEIEIESGETVSFTTDKITPIGPSEVFADLDNRAVNHG